MDDKKTDDKLTMRPLSKETIEALDGLKDVKGLDNIIEFLSELNDQALGFTKEKISLCSVLEDLPKDFDFHEEYYSSSIANQNRTLSEEQDKRFADLRSQREDNDDHFINQILHKDTVELRKSILRNLEGFFGDDN
jgi:hypothetical protein